LNKFRVGHTYDKLVIGLGAEGYDLFAKDYPKFSTTSLYDPENFSKDSQYAGLSGGGGGGWGGEIAVVGPQGPVVQFAFGGGGGGGMNSYQPPVPPEPGKKPTPIAISGLGAGGGGGAQFASGYYHNGTSYNGLGLGAGVGSTSLVPKSPVQYSYNDYQDPPRLPLHDFNAAVVDDYEAQLENLAAQLKSKYNAGKRIVIRGGGGMGAGTQFLSSAGAAFLPQALSTTGGWQFSYEFAKIPDPGIDPGAQALDSLNADQSNLYQEIGESWKDAAAIAFEACGRDYSKFACMCPIEHAIVVCKATEAVGGDPTKVPGWLQQRHCPGDDNASGFSGYQGRLLAAANTINDASCATALTSFFNVQNSPVSVP
jgi:hypothetical protein